MATTFRDQIDLFYEIVGDDDDSELYPLETVKAQINNGESTFIDAKTNWNFLRDKLLYNTLATVTLGSAYTSPGTSIELSDSSTWPTASDGRYAGMIEGDIIASWTGNTANVLSGMPGLQIDHSDTSKKVYPLYVLPSTIAKIADVTVDDISYEFIDEDHYDEYTNKYTIVQDDYLLLPEIDAGNVIQIPYYKAPVILTNDSDESLLPEDYRYAPVYYAVGKILLNTDEISKARQYCYFNPNTQKFEGLFGDKLYEAMKRFATKTASNKRRIRVQKRLQAK